MDEMQDWSVEAVQLIKIRQEIEELKKKLNELENKLRQYENPHMPLSRQRFKGNKGGNNVFSGKHGGVIGHRGFTGMGSSGAMTFVLIFIMGYDLHTSIGTSLMMMFFIAGSGAITHGLRGEILPTVALFAGLGALVGATSGSFFANRIDEEKLGRLIGLIITILGLSVLIELLI